MEVDDEIKKYEAKNCDKRTSAYFRNFDRYSWNLQANMLFHLQNLLQRGFPSTIDARWFGKITTEKVFPEVPQKTTNTQKSARTRFST